MASDYVSDVNTVLSIVVLLLWLLSWFAHTTAIIFGLRHLYKRLEPPIPTEELPGVSIIKPLTGVDNNLKCNLETFFTLEYPKYELLFSVPDDDDPAIPVVNNLIESYPNVNAQLFVGLKTVGPNGKVNNMVRPYEATKYNNVVISDSGIKMLPKSLYEMVYSLKPDVGLVLQMPYCATRKGLKSIYQQVYFGTMQARACLSANALHINCSTGMSCLLRRNVLNAAGGLHRFGKYLAEDHFIADAIRGQGYKVMLATTPALQNSGNWSIADFHQRLIRWAQLRVSIIPWLIIFEPIGESILLGLLTSAAFNFLFNISPVTFLFCHFLVWLLSDYILFRIVENGPLPFALYYFVVAWLLREVLSPYITICSHLQKHVVWRNNIYKLNWGGEIELRNPSNLETVKVSA